MVIEIEWNSILWVSDNLNLVIAYFLRAHAGYKGNANAYGFFQENDSKFSSCIMLR